MIPSKSIPGLSEKVAHPNFLKSKSQQLKGEQDAEEIRDSLSGSEFEISEDGDSVRTIHEDDVFNSQEIEEDLLKTPTSSSSEMIKPPKGTVTVEVVSKAPAVFTKYLEEHPPPPKPKPKPEKAARIRYSVTEIPNEAPQMLKREPKRSARQNPPPSKDLAQKAEPLKWRRRPMENFDVDEMELADHRRRMKIQELCDDEGGRKRESAFVIKSKQKEKVRKVEEVKKKKVLDILGTPAETQASKLRNQEVRQ
jgi:hypothetical protein